MSSKDRLHDRQNSSGEVLNYKSKQEDTSKQGAQLQNLQVLLQNPQ